jgi:hypothetical protein
MLQVMRVQRNRVKFGFASIPPVRSEQHYP